MTWLRRPHATTEPVDAADPEDAPEALLRRLFEMTQEVNQAAGRLPGEAVVVARRVLDTVREIVGTSAERELDVRAVGSVRGILGDYLPTTLHAYLALDPGVVDVARPSGRTPSESLIEQLDALWSSATDLLEANQAHDADALLTQGSFLRTKFTRSDLDL
jgi:hypothetical protein